MHEPSDSVLSGKRTTPRIAKKTFVFAKIRDSCVVRTRWECHVYEQHFREIGDSFVFPIGDHFVFHFAKIAQRFVCSSHHSVFVVLGLLPYLLSPLGGAACRPVARGCAPPGAPTLS